MPPRIWAFLSNRPGDNAQVLALAEELGLPFVTKPLHYSWRKRMPRSGRRVSLMTLTRKSRIEQIFPPWPDLIILVGPRAQPVARWVKKASGGKTRLVLINHPRAPASEFDLVFTTRQYLPPSGDNVRLLPVAMSRFRSPLEPTQAERAWLEQLPRPHLLLMIGGPTRYWALSPAYMTGVAARLLARANKLGGALIAAGSARTERPVLQALASRFAGRPNLRLAIDQPRFQALVDDADELFPTADSVSMISESIITGKPVGVVAVEPKLLAKLVLGGEKRMARNPARDLRRFWNFLRGQGLVGTIDKPVASEVPNPVIAAAQEVRDLLAESSDAR
jgi:mitochondrial fission protein ELM1